MSKTGLNGLTRSELTRALRDERRRARAYKTRVARFVNDQRMELELLRRDYRHQRDDLIEARRQLEDAWTRYYEVVDFGPIGYVTIDERAKIVHINLAGCSLFGRDRDQLCGKPLTLLLRTEGRSFLNLMRNCRLNTGVLSESFGVFSNGGIVPCHIWMEYIRRDRMFQAAIVDISRQVELENERRAAQESERLAKATSEAKDEFIAMLSHELRTPLTPIVAAASTLCRRPDLPSDVIEQIKTIRRNAELEARLIDDLLDMTRIRQNKLMLNPATVDVHAILSETLGVFNEQISAKALRLRLSLNAPRYHVYADSVRLRQILANLIDNAVKFTPPGGEIGVFTRYDDDERLTVAVRDSGIGMTRSVLEHLFMPFERVPDDSRRLGGLGLGLAISKRLVDAQAGTIRASSPGRECGSLFEVTFPTVPALRTDQTSDGGDAGPDVRPIEILVVEDHRDSAEMLAVLLSSAGHHVKIAGNVRSALEMAQEGCDLLISDIALPDGTGLDLLQRLQAERPISGIALSGYGGAEIENKSREAGFSEHLVKPVNFERLIAVVNRVAQHV